MNNKTVKVTIEFEVIVPKLIEAIGIDKAKEVVRGKFVKYCKDVNKRIKFDSFIDLVEDDTIIVDGVKFPCIEFEDIKIK